MFSKEIRNVSVTAELNPFICGQMTRGQYRTVSEAAHASLRLHIRAQRCLEAGSSLMTRVWNGR